MRIDDIMAAKQSFSFEIFPPKGELTVEKAGEVAGELADCHPDWISVTFSAGGSGNSAATADIARDIQRSNKTQALAHLTCLGSTKANVDEFVARLVEGGVDNVLALRGDYAPGREATDFSYAKDLIAYLADSGLCVGAACYPEGHVECEDLRLSIEHLKQKQDAGAAFLVTQLFFDNEYFYRFRDLADRARIKIPIAVGIMPFTSVKQIQRMSFTCGASIPSKVIKRLVAAGDDAAAQREAGVAYACEQLVDLAANGVDGLHIYSMNRPEVGHAVHAALRDCGYLAE
jgi:methylenetetrahydrofolate reductase (NADPH)